MPLPADFQRASFTPQTGGERGRELTVHFNPVSLEYTVANTLEAGSGNDTKQYVSQSTGKLTMELVFDTSGSGEDVRAFTERVARFMEPDENKIPPVVLFEWGTYKFQGMLESYKETLDFFAANGVPLRASVNVTLSRQDKVFEPSERSSAATGGSLAPDAVEVPPGPDDTASGLAGRAGDSSAGRALAAANGLESMRFPGSASLSVGGSVSLGPPVAFASGGAGLSLGVSAGASAGISLGGGAGLSAGAGVSAGAGLGGSAGVSLSGGGRLSAGVSASAGAFAGLRSAGGSARATARLDPSRLLPPPPTPQLATDVDASFQVGGQAALQGSASLRADVGAAASLRSRVVFEG